MKWPIIVIVLFVLFCGTSCSYKEERRSFNKEQKKINYDSNRNIQKSIGNCDKRIIGVYKYGDDSLVTNCYTLIFNCLDGELQGTFFGPRPDPDHGKYYFLSKFDKIKIQDLEIDFDFIIGDLYTFPITEKNIYSVKDSLNGFENTTIYLKGFFEQDSLNLGCVKCVSENYFLTMKFVKVK